jgi:hypothetical protein
MILKDFMELFPVYLNSKVAIIWLLNSVAIICAKNVAKIINTEKHAKFMTIMNNSSDKSK